MEIVGTIILDGDVTLLFGMVQADAGGETVLEFVLKMPERGRKFGGSTALFTASFFTAGCSGKMLGNQLLRITDGSIRAYEFLGEKPLFVGVFDREENFGMTDAQASLGQVSLNFLFKLHESHRIGNGCPTLADATGDIFLGEAEFLGKAAIGGGFLDRIEPFALEILDESQLQDFLIGGLADNDGSLVKAYFQRGAEAAFTGYEFVFSCGKADDQRLDDSPFTDGFNKFVKLLDGKLGAWLKRAWDNLVESDILDAFPQFFGGDGSGDTGVDQGAKAFAKPLSEAFAKSSPLCFLPARRISIS